MIAATSWNGWDHGLGTCTVHSWNDGADGDEIADEGESSSLPRYKKFSSLGSTPMGARVTAQLQHDERFYGSGAAGRTGAGDPRRARMAQRMGLGALWGDESDEE